MDHINADLIVTEIKRVELRPGDLIVLRSPYRLTRTSADALVETVRAAIPDRRVMVLLLDEGVEIDVVSPIDAHRTGVLEF